MTASFIGNQIRGVERGVLMTASFIGNQIRGVEGGGSNDRLLLPKRKREHIIPKLRMHNAHWTLRTCNRTKHDLSYILRKIYAKK